jgi:hypothetical protein
MSSSGRQYERYAHCSVEGVDLERCTASGDMRLRKSGLTQTYFNTFRRRVGLFVLEIR